MAGGKRTKLNPAPRTEKKKKKKKKKRRREDRERDRERKREQVERHPATKWMRTLRLGFAAFPSWKNLAESRAVSRLYTNAQTVCLHQDMSSGVIKLFPVWNCRAAPMHPPFSCPIATENSKSTYNCKKKKNNNGQYHLSYIMFFHVASYK